MSSRLWEVKPMGACKRTATALAVDIRDGVPYILLVTARSKPHLWVLPKGTVEPGESTEDAALREAREEAGVSGALGQFVGEFEYRHGSIMYAWLLDAPRELSEEVWAERFERKRRWMSVYDAKAHMVSSGLAVQKPEQVQVLDAVLRILGFPIN